MDKTGIKKAKALIVARDLAEFNLWRRGVGKYAWDEDPKVDNADIPFTQKHLGYIIDKAVTLLREYGDDNAKGE